ncbi:MAG TPA: TIGR03084 family metal-binding protein, partial [Nocardioides sp.]
DAVVLAAVADPTGFVDAAALAGARAAPGELLDRWRTARRSMAAELAAYPVGQKLPWFGPPMSPTSMATARFMETWAHSQDMHDALGAELEVTDRIRHVAHLGVRTRDFAYAVHEEVPPADDFRVELTAPSGATWTWGPQDAAQSVTGPAHDFCLLVTQRVHRDNTALVASGADAEHWLGIAQAFAGPPGGGREATGA